MVYIILCKLKGVIMPLCCLKSEKDKISKRLRRIQGQIGGIEKMIDSDKDCVDVLDQISSASSALKGVWKAIVASHLNGHIKDAILSKKNSQKMIDELIEQLNKIR